MAAELTSRLRSGAAALLIACCAVSQTVSAESLQAASEAMRAQCGASARPAADIADEAFARLAPGVAPQAGEEFTEEQRLAYLSALEDLGGDLVQALLDGGCSTFDSVYHALLKGGDLIVVDVISRAYFVAGPAAEGLIRSAAAAAANTLLERQAAVEEKARAEGFTADSTAGAGGNLPPIDLDRVDRALALAKLRQDGGTNDAGGTTSVE